MADFSKKDVLDWFAQNKLWQEYFDYLINSNNFTQLYFGSWNTTRTLVSDVFKDRESVVDYFISAYDSRRRSSFGGLTIHNKESFARWIIYNLLNLALLNRFLLAAKDVTINSTARGISDTFNVGALGPKYQTGWVSLSDGKLYVSFVFWGKGDGTKASLNQNRLKCSINLLTIDEFKNAAALELKELSQLSIKAIFTLQYNAGKGMQKTIFTTWKDILTEARNLR